MIDIIIPVLNEERILREQEMYYKTLASVARVFFVDGGSTDQTVEVAQSYGQVIRCAQGRGLQKNVGAKASDAEYILFLHVDACVDINALKNIFLDLPEETLAGCFVMCIDDPRLLFRVYEWTVNFRARIFGVMDGDLGLLIRRDVFDRVGGFDETAIMEDVLLGKKMRKHASVKVFENTINVSSRKWDERGFIKTFYEYTCAYIQLWTGIKFFK